jgi:hypothetical protein
VEDHPDAELVALEQAKPALDSLRERRKERVEALDEHVRVSVPDLG